MQDWFSEVEATIERHSLLKHPFYQAWQEGRLTLEDLREYAREYYPHVAAFPRYVSAAHSACEDLGVRQMLLENLVEEERGSENHPELWARFAGALGVERGELGGAAGESCSRTFLEISKRSALSGLSALFAYESQIPAVSRTKIEGLGKFYGMNSPEALKFFEVHAEADVWHSGQEREAILKMAQTPEARKEVLVAVEQSCKAVNGLLDAVCAKRGIHCPAMN